MRLQSAHGITNEFLADKARFADIADDLLAYLGGAELVIHKTPFDVGFLDAELAWLEGYGTTLDHCAVPDTLVMARKKHPGQRNSLRCVVRSLRCRQQSPRQARGFADAEILADVYLAMTGGQGALSLDVDAGAGSVDDGNSGIQALDREGLQLVVVRRSG